jgi:glycolate oxidase FAD binding subunit
VPSLDAFAEQIGREGPVTIAGLGTRGGPVRGVPGVRAPSGIDWIQPDEMTMSCGAGTPVADVGVALAEVGQRISVPDGGTVGGALAAGRSGIRRLGDGFVRDVLLQAKYVSAAGDVVKAGGPTVKNVTGFDVCRLLVGSFGTLGFLGEVIVRTRPIAPHSQWFSRPSSDPMRVFAALHRPVSVLWDGANVWALLEGHPLDVAERAGAAAMIECAGPPPLPTGSRRLVRPADVTTLVGEFVAEVGTGVVHHADPEPSRRLDDVADRLAARVKREFDPTGRLNPGITLG